MRASPNISWDKFDNAGFDGDDSELWRRDTSQQTTPRATQEAAMTQPAPHYHGGAIMPAYTGRFEVYHIPALQLSAAKQVWSPRPSSSWPRRSNRPRVDYG